jgi:hypothetical protein
MKPLRLTVIAAVVLGVAAMGGRAYAVFTSTASGAGTATIVSELHVDVQLDGAGEASKELIPDATATVTAKVTNPNALPVILDSVTATGITTGKVGCPGDVLSVELVPDPLPFGNGEQKTITVNVTMSAGAPSACQGASFTIPLTVKVRTSA